MQYLVFALVSDKTVWFMAAETEDAAREYIRDEVHGRDGVEYAWITQATYFVNAEEMAAEAAKAA